MESMRLRKLSTLGMSLDSAPQEYLSTASMLMAVLSAAAGSDPAQSDAAIAPMEMALPRCLMIVLLLRPRLIPVRVGCLGRHHPSLLCAENSLSQGEMPRVEMK